MYTHIQKEVLYDEDIFINIIKCKEQMTPSVSIRDPKPE
jgi:hypothetical protein